MTLKFNFDREKHKGTFDHFINCYFKSQYCGYACEAKIHNESYLWSHLVSPTVFRDCVFFHGGKMCNQYDDTNQKKIDCVIDILKTIDLK